MATLVLSYKLMHSESSISRTLCMPFVPSQVQVEVRADAKIILRHPSGGGKRIMTLGQQELHTLMFVLENLTSVQLRSVDNVSWTDK